MTRANRRDTAGAGVRHCVQGYMFRMPNAIKMLQDDQNSMRILFGQIQQLPAGQFGGENEAALQLASMVSAHNTLVEEFIHPLLADLRPEEAEEAEAVRAETRRMLAKIDGIPAGLDRRDALLELQGVVKDQGEQEEAVYPFLTEKLGLVKIEDLGRSMMARQQELLHEGEDTTNAASTARPQVAATPKI